jgi:membrane-associated phospholipid phosphatase
MLGFLAINTAFLLWRAPVLSAWPVLLLANLLTVGLILLLARSRLSPVVVFLGGAYPLILTLGFYTQLGIITQAVAHLKDPVVQGWEEALFGGQVSVTWHQSQPAALLSWLLHICYASYYWLVVLPPLYLFARRGPEAFERGTFLVSLAFYACYLVFLLFPVAGPRYFFGNAAGPAAEVPPARLVRELLEGGSAWGTAFPSSHVAASWCAVASLWPYARGLFWGLAPVAVGLAVGTVYGQFHYAVDSLAGAALAVALTLGAGRLRRALAREA